MEKEITGVFDGQCLIGSDGKKYPVPGNYTSKSKLLEGDTLILRISEEGDFFYKQVCPVPRKRILAKVVMENGLTMVTNETNILWHVCASSVSYYKLKSGDEVIAIIPRDKPAFWAAIEMVTEQRK
ncbi:MAG TPA: hypothetical protein VK255_03235 [Patescibacteria group bacterium]|nr:hypothetical protein [Patescibacteria group bacterium]